MQGYYLEKILFPKPNKASSFFRLVLSAVFLGMGLVLLLQGSSVGSGWMAWGQISLGVFQLFPVLYWRLPESAPRLRPVARALFYAFYGAWFVYCWLNLRRIGWTTIADYFAGFLLLCVVAALVALLFIRRRQATKGVS